MRIENKLIFGTFVDLDIEPMDKIILEEPPILRSYKEFCKFLDEEENYS